MSQTLISEIQTEVGSHTRWLARAIIDTAFLALWAITHYMLNGYVFSQYVLTGTDALIFAVLQYVGVFSTLVPILIQTLKDIIKTSVEGYDDVIVFFRNRKQLAESVDSPPMPVSE